MHQGAAVGCIDHQSLDDPASTATGAVEVVTTGQVTFQGLADGVAVAVDTASTYMTKGLASRTA